MMVLVGSLLREQGAGHLEPGSAAKGDKCHWWHFFLLAREAKKQKTRVSAAMALKTLSFEQAVCVCGGGEQDCCIFFILQRGRSLITHFPH